MRASDPRSWSARAAERPLAELSFRYGGVSIAFTDPREVVARLDERRLFRRDRGAETAAAAKVLEAGFQRAPEQFGQSGPDRYDISLSKLSGAVGLLLEAGWHVEAEGKLYRQPGRFKLSVTSGIDWFELHGEVDFGGETAAAAASSCAALRRGET